MKRISILVMAFMVLFSCSAFAKNWQWVDSDDSIGFFFDSDSIKYEAYQDFYTNKVKYNRLVKTYWVKTIYTQKGANNFAKSIGDDSYNDLSVCLEKWTTNKDSITILYSVYYDSNGNVIHSNDESFSMPIVPESFVAEVIDAVNMFCFANDYQVVRNSR